MSAGHPGAAPPRGKARHRRLRAGSAAIAGWLVAAPALLGAGALAASPAERFGAHTAGSTATVDHSAWDALLAEYVRDDDEGPNLVDYARWQREGREPLRAYLDMLAGVDTVALDRPEQFAFWANLYNATTIDVVLGHYPVASIRDIRLGGGLRALVIGGPWQAAIVRVGDATLSLDDLEHAILRPLFADPRVHYALNCASLGCPDLARRAWRGADLDARLDEAARTFVNAARGVRVDADGVTASSIYSWFQEDFGGSEAGVLAHLRRYADAGLAARLETVSSIDDYAYDWNLNDLTGDR